MCGILKTHSSQSACGHVCVCVLGWVIVVGVEEHYVNAAHCERRVWSASLQCLTGDLGVLPFYVRLLKISRASQILLRPFLTQKQGI